MCNSGVHWIYVRYYGRWTYILAVRYQWKQDGIKKGTPYLIGIPIVTTLVVCTTALIYDSLNWSGFWACDFSGSPFGCDYADSKIDCKRGIHASKIGVSVIFWMSTYCVIIVGSMFLLFWTVFKQEKANDRFKFRGLTSTKKHSKPLAVQGILYVVAFLLPHTLHWLSALLPFFGGFSPLALVFVMAVVSPLQGLFNALVCFRPTYLEHLRRKKMGTKYERNIANANKILQPEFHENALTEQRHEVDIEAYWSSSSLP